MTDAFLLIGILDPGRFAGGAHEARRRARRSRRSSASTPRSTSPSASSYAYRMGLNNIAEGIVDISIGHGIDPRDYSLLAFGAAGPMMLPALLDETRVQSVIVPPHPGLFSALGLLSLRPGLRRQPQLLPDAQRRTPRSAVDTLFPQMEDGPARRSSATALEGVEFERSFDGRLVGQTWETPFIDVPGGDDRPPSDRRDDRELPRRLPAAAGNRFDALPGPGRHLPGAGRGADRQGRLPADRPRATAARPTPAARSRCAASMARR